MEKNEAQPIRVLVVDDDALVRRLLGIILSAQGIEVVAQASDGDEVVTAVQAHHPDVVLMDIRMERMSGIDATRELRKLPAPPGVVALTSFDTQALVLDAVHAGAVGFLPKDSAPEEIVAAVRSVAADESALSPRAARFVLERVQASQMEAKRIEAQRSLSTLSEREREVALAIGSGSGNDQIARDLHLSVATVKTHLASALTKADVQNRTQLAVLVARAGWALD